MDAERRKRLEETTRYEPSEVEGRILERWLEGGYFHPPAEGTPAENFSIAIPPPNVTGVLHMGHALNGTIQDALTRINRMRGRNTLWALGTDHAGIATQAVVERELREEGTSRHEIGREAFVEPRLEVAGAIRLDDHRAVQAARRVVRLRARALHPRRALRAGRVPGLRAALREGLHPPRQLHGQLGRRLALGDLRPRGRESRGRGHAVRHRLSRRGVGWSPHRRDGPPRDDARRHRGRREPHRSSAIEALIGAALRPSPGRAPASDDRRRARRP